MTAKIAITEICFTPADPKKIEQGLLGWVQCLLNNVIRLDGLTVRRTRLGHLSISFPGRKDSSGIVRHYFKPLDDAARRQIEIQIFKAIGIREQ